MQNFSLAVIAAANLVSLLYAVRWLAGPESQLRSIMKTLPVGMLLIAAVIGSVPLMIAAGLAACMIGDWFLSLEGERNFLFGLTAFLVGHLFYTGFFTSHVQSGFLASPLAIETGIVLLALIGAVLVRLWPFLGEMRLPVIVYSLVIALMAFTAKLSGAGLIVLSGIALFVISDIILANDKFTPLTNSNLRRAMPYAVWLLYFIGQSLIVSGFIFAT